MENRKNRKTNGQKVSWTKEGNTERFEKIKGLERRYDIFNLWKKINYWPKTEDIKMENSKTRKINGPKLPEWPHDFSSLKENINWEQIKTI